MIYILEDDKNIRELVVYTFCSTGMEAMGFETPSAFWAQMEKELPSLVLLDLMLPEEDGLSVLKKLRQAPLSRKLPVLLLTAKDSEYDKVLGLNEGADDYVTKPFGMMELVARVHALLRRTGAEEKEDVYTLGILSLYPAKHQVTVDGEEVILTKKEYELLCLLLEHPQIVFTRDQLLDRIWGYSFDGESRTVDVHIRTLRQKLGEAGKLIQTVRGVGYRLGGKEI